MRGGIRLEQFHLHLEYRQWSNLSLPELAVVTLYTGIFGPIILKEKGIKYLYASLDKHPDVRSMVRKAKRILLAWSQ